MMSQKNAKTSTHSSPSQALLIHVDEEWVVWRHQHVQPHIKLELCKQKQKSEWFAQVIQRAKTLLTSEAATVVAKEELTIYE